MICLKQLENLTYASIDSAVVIESLGARQGVVAAAAIKLITQCCIMKKTFRP